MASVRKLYTFQNLLKNITLLPAVKFRNINLYQQTVLLKIIYDIWIEISFMDKQKFVISKKLHSDRYVFSITINLFLWDKNNEEFFGHDQEKITWNFQGSSRISWP